jgi:hypothetical protein
MMPCHRCALVGLALLSLAFAGCGNKRDRFEEVMARHDDDVRKLEAQWDRMAQQADLGLKLIGLGGNNEWLLREMERTRKENQDTFDALVGVLRGEFQEAGLTGADVKILWRDFFAKRKKGKAPAWKG